MTNVQSLKEFVKLTSDEISRVDSQAQIQCERKFHMQMKAYETAIETRKFEIQLFWTRSLFFWGFIASAFVAYAALYRASSGLTVVVSCFGLVCSFAWSLGNRGSKYWQESWETKVEKMEPSITGTMFSVPENVQCHKTFWLRARMFSVSKLAIALSDYTILLWLSLILWEIIRLFGAVVTIKNLKMFSVIGFIFSTITYCGLVIFFCRSSTQKDESHSSKRG